MEKIFEDFLNKKSDLFEVSCNCGNKYYVFSEAADAFSVCSKCQKKHYELTCKHCQSGISYQEDSSQIDTANKKWKCIECKKDNEGLPGKQFKSYQKEEIPLEVFKENDSRTLLPKWVFKILILVVIVYFVFKNFIIK